MLKSPQSVLHMYVAPSVLAASLLYPDPASAAVASHQHHPPRAPDHPNRAVSMATTESAPGLYTLSPSLCLCLSAFSPLSLFSSVQPEPHSKLQAAAYFSLRRLFVFAPYCSCLDARWRKKDSLAWGAGLWLLCWVSMLRFELFLYITRHLISLLFSTLLCSCLGLSLCFLYSAIISFHHPFLIQTNRVHSLWARVPQDDRLAA